MNQEEVFNTFEADNWFKRNCNALDSISYEEDKICTMLQNHKYLDNISSVLELGCSSGYRLNLLKKILPHCKKFVGMDISEQAVKHGIQKYGLELYQDSLTTFAYPEQFDMVIVSGVLCVLERKNLYQCIANIDKLLKVQNSYLVLHDFYPFHSYKKRNHHVANEYIYI